MYQIVAAKSDPTGIILNIAEPIDVAAGAVRFRECEFTADELKTEQFSRILDSRLPMSEQLRIVLDSYTINESQQNIVTLDDFKQRYYTGAMDTFYEQLEVYYEALKDDGSYSMTH